VVDLDADNNPDKMGLNVEDLIAKGVDGIIHVAYWNTGVKVLTAKAANIPVVFADVYLPDISPQDKRFPNYIAFVGPSDETAGYEMATTLFKAMQPNEKGEKVVGVVDGTPGTSVAIDRRKGFDRALKENKDVRLAGSVNGNFVRDTSQTAFESLYQGNPDIKGVWAANGGTATGVTKELIAQFRKDYPKGIPDYDWKQHSKIYNPEAVPTLELTYSNAQK
jgi:ABC-type sugar transport system substrate-binding protein